MARGTRPPPLTLSPPPTARTQIVRHSRFIETPMLDNAPPPNNNMNSMFEDDEEDGPSRRPLVMALRLVNDGMHAAACSVLLAIMALFLRNVPTAMSRGTGYVLML